MATYEYKGKWWLPSKEEDKVSGVLSYTPGESIELVLTVTTSAAISVI